MFETPFLKIIYRYSAVVIYIKYHFSTHKSFADKEDSMQNWMDKNCDIFDLEEEVLR